MNGWNGEPLSEWKGLPRRGGPACAAAMAGLGRWRTGVDQRDSITATADADGGHLDRVSRRLARVERDLAVWSGRDDQIATDRVAALTAMREWLLTLLRRGHVPAAKESWG